MRLKGGLNEGIRLKFATERDFDIRNIDDDVFRTGIKNYLLSVNKKIDETAEDLGIGQSRFRLYIYSDKRKIPRSFKEEMIEELGLDFYKEFIIQQITEKRGSKPGRISNLEIEKRNVERETKLEEAYEEEIELSIQEEKNQELAERNWLNERFDAGDIEVETVYFFVNYFDVYCTITEDNWKFLYDYDSLSEELKKQMYDKLQSFKNKYENLDIILNDKQLQERILSYKTMQDIYSNKEFKVPDESRDMIWEAFNEKLDKQYSFMSRVLSYIQLESSDWELLQIFCYVEKVKEVNIEYQADYSFITNIGVCGQNN